MTKEICLHCGKEFNLNDDIDRIINITCVGCLREHFRLTELIYKKIRKDIKNKKGG